MRWSIITQNERDQSIGRGERTNAIQYGFVRNDFGSLSSSQMMKSRTKDEFMSRSDSLDKIYASFSVASFPRPKFVNYTLDASTKTESPNRIQIGGLKRNEEELNEWEMGG